MTNFRKIHFTRSHDVHVYTYKTGVYYYNHDSQAEQYKLHKIGLVNAASHIHLHTIYMGYNVCTYIVSHEFSENNGFNNNT